MRVVAPTIEIPQFAHRVNQRALRYYARLTPVLDYVEANLWGQFPYEARAGTVSGFYPCRGCSGRDDAIAALSICRRARPPRR